MELSGYPQKRQLAIADEHKREVQVFQKSARTLYKVVSFKNQFIEFDVELKMIY